MLVLAGRRLASMILIMVVISVLVFLLFEGDKFALATRVLGQYDPQLLGTEPMSPDGLYLVETNVEEWGRNADLPGEDLRRWLILHEMTHAWQFAAHPWLKDYMESSMRVLLESATKAGPAAARVAAFAGVLPAQWRVMRQMQGTMSFVEGYSNLVMNELGSTTLASFDRLEEAYRARGRSRSVVEILIWRLTGLDLKLQQYQRGEAFAKAIYDAYGMDVLNQAWNGADSMPNLDELANPERWYRRIVGVRRSRHARPQSGVEGGRVDAPGGRAGRRRPLVPESRSLRGRRTSGE